MQSARAVDAVCCVAIQLILLSLYSADQQPRLHARDAGKSCTDSCYVININVCVQYVLVPRVYGLLLGSLSTIILLLKKTPCFALAAFAVGLVDILMKDSAVLKSAVSMHA